jgi:hypothetical protein
LETNYQITNFPEALMATKPSNPEPDAGHVPLTEEMDSFKHTMPDAAPVIISLVLVAIVLGVVAYIFRPQPVANGTIDEAYAAAVPNRNTVLATVQLTVKNVSKKPITIRNINITVRTDQSEFSDDSASVTDFPRYFAAFPDLQQHSIEGLAREMKIPAGQQLSGSVIVSLPVTKEQFDNRRGLVATVSFYDQRSIEIKR